MSGEPDVTVSEPIEGTRWVYCGGTSVRVDPSGNCYLSLRLYFPEELPDLIATLHTVHDLVTAAADPCPDEWDTDDD